MQRDFLVKGKQFLSDLFSTVYHAKRSVALDVGYSKIAAHPNVRGWSVLRRGLRETRSRKDLTKNRYPTLTFVRLDVLVSRINRVYFYSPTLQSTSLSYTSRPSPTSSSPVDPSCRGPFNLPGDIHILRYLLCEYPALKRSYVLYR